MELNMFWAQVGVTLLSAFIMFSASQTLKAIQRKQKAAEDRERARSEHEETVNNALRAILRDRILQGRRFFVEQKYIPTAEYENLEQMYKVYHDGLGGNGLAEKAFTELSQLPFEKNEEA